MLRAFFRPVVGLAIIAGSYGATVPVESSSVPLALRAANPDMLSGGLFAALDADGVFTGMRPVRAFRQGMTDLSKGKPPAVLDARVGINIRLGDDPAALPASQIGQAEPHIYRSVSDPNVLLATFQEGRYYDAGSLDCGYAISRDGGLTWTRALIPQLTQSSGGSFNRATDPVAGIGPQGDLYLNTLGSISGAFSSAAVLVSRSTDGGASWSAPVAVFTSTSTTVAPDKNWLAVNDYAGTPNAGRLVVTWTNFTSASSGTSTGNNIVGSVSDDRGVTWSAPIAVTPSGSVNQGSQPVYLPDGSLAVVYVTFPNPSTTSQFSINCRTSLDGGRTFPASGSTAVPLVFAWDDPDLRDGVFLPSAAAARQSGDLYIAYTAVNTGTPKVYVAKSTDRGTTWNTPVVVSDNPTGVSVMNPAVAVTPDGQTVSVVFMDRRNTNATRTNLDIYLAQSFDGGATWQPNIRLTDMTNDIRYATPTSRGYMLGDYLGVAPALASDEPAVAIWCDTRTGDADPLTARFAPVADESFSAWAIARGVAPQLPAGDPDQDGYFNAVEFKLGSNPLANEGGETFMTHQVSPGVFDVAWVERTASSTYPVTTVANPPPDRIVTTVTPSVALTSDQLPSIAVGDRLHWVGLRYTAAPEAPFSVGHALKFSAGIPPYVSGEIAPANTDSRLINVSSRGNVGSDANQMIVGFVIDGPKTMLVRAAGPALLAYDVPNYLAAPRLTLSPLGSTTSLASNAGWQQSTASSTLFTRLGAFPFAPGSTDTALVQTLAAGGYTAVVSGANGGTGVSLVEAYDADPTPGLPTGPRVLNLSTRAVAGTGTDTLIAGFVITGSQPRRVLIRAVGPTLTQFGIATPLSDPVLTLYQGKTAVATNDDWQISQSWPAIAATAQRVGAFALNDASLDAALLITLAPGGYSVTVTSADGGTGIALVEVYDAD